ncbi:MAG: molybdopterin-binding protein, partial [Pseudomonadota bacterium]
MTAFDTILMVDWSGGNDRGPTPVKDAIWSAIWRRSGAEAARYHRNRDAVEGYLGDVIDAELAAGRRILLGFDFPFGYPAGFAEAVTGTPDPLALWDWFERELQDSPKSNNRFELAGALNRRFPGVGPFWFNATKADIPELPRKGNDRTDHHLPERRAVEDLESAAFSVWQMGGAGAVGGQVPSGLAVLSRLRRRFGADVAVWPFERADKPVVLAEVWPSLVDEQVRKETGPDDIRDAVQVAVLARAIGGLADADLARLLEDVGPSAHQEGWIFGAGAQETLLRAAQPSSMPGGVDWLPVEDALDRLRSRVHPVTQTESIALSQAGGRVVASSMIAQRSNPPAANSAVDGYGLAFDTIQSAPIDVPLVAGRAAAGAPLDGNVPPGCAVRILTGALLPTGVDTVLLEEEVAIKDGRLFREKPLRRGANTRAAGEDVKAGAVLFEQGARLSAPDLAILAATGAQSVDVYRRLRVGVLSTGSELAAPDPSLGGGRTFDANRPMLLEMLARWGHEAVDLGIIPDDRDTLRDTLNLASRTLDAVLTSGGASSGDEDHVSALLNAEADVAAWRIAIKPGRPQALAEWKGMTIFALPGNPVAAFVCTLIFAPTPEVAP